MCFVLSFREFPRSDVTLGENRWGTALNATYHFREPVVDAIPQPILPVSRLTFLNVFDTSSIERDGLHQKMVIPYWFKNTTWIHIHTHIAETPRFSTCIEYKSQTERFQIQTGKIVSTIPGNTILRGGVGHQRCSHGASRHCARVPWLRWWRWVWWVANWTILKRKKCVPLVNNLGVFFFVFMSDMSDISLGSQRPH